MKLKAAFLAAALVAASATSAGSTTATGAAPADLAARFPTTKVVQDLDDCQLPHYLRCMAITGDDGYCYNAVQSYACP
jgi:hypothetical protein